jgi:hypothetical protein
VRKDFAAATAKFSPVLLQACDDLFRDRHGLTAKPINIWLASCLLISRAWFGHRRRSRETKRCHYGDPCRIPHLKSP